MEELREMAQSALSRYPPLPTDLATAAKRAASHAANAGSAAARVAAAARELAAAVAEANYWGTPDVAVDSGGGGGGDRGGGEGGGVDGVGEGRGGVGRGGLHSAVPREGAPPPSVPHTPATTVAAAAATAATAAALALAQRNSQPARERARVWVPPSPPGRVATRCDPSREWTADWAARSPTSSPATARGVSGGECTPASECATQPMLPRSSNAAPLEAPHERDTPARGFNGGECTPPSECATQPVLARSSYAAPREEAPREIQAPPHDALPIARAQSGDSASSNSPYKRGCRESPLSWGARASSPRPLAFCSSSLPTDISESISEGPPPSPWGARASSSRPPACSLPTDIMESSPCDSPAKSPYKRGTRVSTPPNQPGGATSTDELAHSMAAESELLQSLRRLHRQFEASLASLHIAPPPQPQRLVIPPPL